MSKWKHPQENTEEMSSRLVKYLKKNSLARIDSFMDADVFELCLDITSKIEPFDDADLMSVGNGGDFFISNYSEIVGNYWMFVYGPNRGARAGKVFDFMERIHDN